jgi:hypothetical protein
MTGTRRDGEIKTGPEGEGISPGGDGSAGRAGKTGGDRDDEQFNSMF